MRFKPESFALLPVATSVAMLTAIACGGDGATSGAGGHTGAGQD